jgi:arginine-tRNA-protein transferase
MLELTILDDYRSTTGPDSCSYLPAEQLMMDYRVIIHLTQREYRELLARGWRKHGLHIFRPACATCRKCRSLRVDISRIETTKSQRRVLKKNQDVELIVQSPTVSPEHVELYNRYHEFMHGKRDWPYRHITQVEYIDSFLAGEYEFAREFLYYRGGQLIGVGLVDIAIDVSTSV